MAFRLHPGRALGAEMLRVIRHQLSAAAAAAKDPKLPASERAHRARVACKRAHAAIALVRPHDEVFWGHEARQLRRAARELAAVRATGALLLTLDALTEQWGDKADARALARARRVLATAPRGGGHATAKRSFDRFGSQLHPAEARITAHLIHGDRFEVIGAGLEHTYRRARSAFRKAGRKRTTRALHAWRKHAKAHAYHFQLLRHAWPEVMDDWGRMLQILGRLLGDEHDLAELHDRIVALGRENDEYRSMRELLELIAVRRTELRDDAIEMGRRAFAEKPTAMVRRLCAWWTTAQDSKTFARKIA